MRPFRHLRAAAAAGRPARRGNIIVLSAALLVVIMGFTAFTVDLGYITLTKSELQKTADGASLAAILELRDGLGPGAFVSSSQAETEAREAAVEVSAANRGGGLDSVYCDGNNDVRVGRYEWDSTTGTYVKAWGVTPYNMAEVTLRRGDPVEGETSSSGHTPLPLFFAPVIGTEDADVGAKGTAAMLAGVGVRSTPQNVGVLPIALDEMTWNDLMAGIGQDNFSYDPDTGEVTSASDGVLEANLYPEGDSSLPPGNRGTVDLGDPNNSTSDLERQILEGLNQEDLSFFNGELRTDGGPLDVNGDTGISAGIKDALETIKGRAVALPLFSEVTGPGNNATFTLTKFVGVRIVEVKLSGGDKRVMVQPALFSHQAVIPGQVSIQHDSIFTHPMLIE